MWAVINWALVYLTLGGMTAAWMWIAVRECDDETCDHESHDLGYEEVVLLVTMWPVWVLLMIAVAFERD